MEEITGPIMAITLALSSVFVPCCFLGGITGQFFRQFAVTIAVSTIISAVNALTMTPSRAVMIFKTEAGGPRPRVQARGAAVVDLRGRGRDAGRLVRAGLRGRAVRPALPLRAGLARPKTPVWMSWAIAGRVFRPRGGGRRAVGWLIIRPVNAVLGWLFRGFNRLFDAMTEVYGWTVGKLLRVSVLVLLVYGGLLVLTVLGLPARPHGLHSAAGPGPADRERPVARLGVAAADPGGHGAGRSRSPARRRAWRTRSPSRGCRSCSQANASNFGSMFIVLDPFDKRQKPGLHAEDIMARLTPRVQQAGQGRDRASCAIPRRSPAWASPAATSSWSRTAAAAGWATCRARPTS